jgi:hypothetical protein
MHIQTPKTIEHVAWQGTLAPLGETFKAAGPRPRVTVGEPVWWRAEDAMATETGKAWSPPRGDRQYGLMRLACTLHPLDDRRSHYREATLSVYLRPRAAGSGPVVAHDLYPRRLTAEDTGTITIGLSPNLKFAGGAEISLLEVGAEIEFPQVFPVVQGYGLGERRPYWRFAHHSGHPLLGCQSVYAVLNAPAASGGVRVSVELVATVETRYGPIRMGLPQEAEAHIHRTLGT